jgi:hypothetical protein
LRKMSSVKNSPSGVVAMRAASNSSDPFMQE